MRVYSTWPGNVYYLHGDHLGSASLTTDAAGNPLAEQRYYPFGETRWVSPTLGTLPTDRRFTGQLALPDLGIYDYGARAYSPLLGRFLSADTIVPRPGDPQAFNRYAYTRNSPLRFIDPSGRDEVDAVHYMPIIVSVSRQLADQGAMKGEIRLPTLAVAAAIASQSNGQWYDQAAIWMDDDPTVGPGQVSPSMVQRELGRNVTANEITDEMSIDVRARIIQKADQHFHRICGSACTSRDRWLVLALEQNDTGLPLSDLWNGTEFEWDSYFSSQDENKLRWARSPGSPSEAINFGRDAVLYLDQGFTARSRYLLRQYAWYLKQFKYIKSFNDVDFKELDTAIDFLNCMGQEGASADDCG